MGDAARHYRGEEGRRYHEQKRGVPEAAVPWVARLRAEKLAPHIRPEDVVFEFGVGSGWNLMNLNCRRRLGFDVADFLAPAVRARGIEVVSNTEQIPSGSVDSVICHHTLEHVPQPAQILTELGRILRPQGQLLLFVPFERERRYRRFQRGEPNHHLYSWNVQTLGNLVEEAGLEVAQAGLGGFGYDRFAAVWALRLHLGETGFRLLRRCLHVLRPAFEVRVLARKMTTGT